MQYDYLKTRPLNEDERRRLRVAVGSALRMRRAVERPSRQRLVHEVLALLENPGQGAKPQVLYWLLCYGNPIMLAHLITALQGTMPREPELRALLHADPAQLLPREHISPDFQRVQNSPKPKTALICFAGNAHKLNIPVHLFHCLVTARFDLIFYLRDFDKQRFTHGIAGMASDLAGLSQSLRRQIPEDCRIAVVGTSAGGYAAAQVAENLGAGRLALFSPPLLFKGVAAAGRPARLPGQCVRLFFAEDNKLDRQLARDWSETDYASSIRWMDTDTHGTLRQLLADGRFNQFLDWMLGSADPGLGQAIAPPVTGWLPALRKAFRLANP